MIQQLPNFEDDRRWQSALSKNWPDINNNDATTCQNTNIWAISLNHRPQIPC